MHNLPCTFFRRVKSFFVFPYISYIGCFYVFELFSIPKYILFVSCLQVVCCPLVPKSCDYEQCCPKLAATALCTTGNQVHCKAAPPYQQAQMMISHVFGKLYFVDMLMIVNVLYFDLYFGGWFALKVTKLSEPSKMHGSSISFNWLMELPTPHHQFGARVCMVYHQLMAMS